MRFKFAWVTLAVWVGAALMLVTADSLRAEEGRMQFEAQLIWATNDKHDPDPTHKPVSAEIREKLSHLPLKWDNYFEVNKVPLSVGAGESRTARISKPCEIVVKNLDGKQVEVSLRGKGDPVWKRTQSMPNGEILILGGNAPNSTAWLIAVKRVK